MLGGGIFELRIFHGPGYRIYGAREGAGFILLLCGGDKASQSKDIAAAQGYLADHRRRTAGD
jgi:putative addiction module killer protein